LPPLVRDEREEECAARDEVAAIVGHGSDCIGRGGCPHPQVSWFMVGADAHPTCGGRWWAGTSTVRVVGDGG
jgi:hypothetical protein